MGMIGRVVGATGAVDAIGDAAEVFVPNATRALELAAEGQRAALDSASAEFQHAGTSRFDRAINGLNRMPRPMLALGTLALFTHAMVDPVSFSLRMRGLAEVPDPLWWLLGAIVSFYFGAREMHYFRTPGERSGGLFGRRAAAPAQAPASDPVSENPALSAWRAEVE